MTNDFVGKVAIVTGATSGIGKATAAHFSRAGAAVVAVGRNADALKDFANEIAGAQRECLTIAVDLNADEAPEQIVRESVERFGGIDVLVNAAGHISSGTIETTSLEAWGQMLNINVRSVFRLMQQAMPLLSARRGNVVNVSSVTGLRSFPGVLAYCVSKAALDQLTRCAALEVAAKGVRINAVNPGVVISNLHRRGGMNEEKYSAFLEHSKATHPIGRPGEPNEIADLIFFLASPNAAWITGETISIDGGRHLTCAR